MQIKIEKILECERDGSIDEALCVTQTMLDEAEDETELSFFLQANLERLMSKAKRLARRIDWSATPLFEHDKNPRQYVPDASEAELPLVSLTTISERLTSCLEVVTRIARSDTAFHSINLYVSPEPYLMDRGVAPQNEMLRQIHEAGANVYSVANTGPYRKMVPLIFQLREAGASEDTRFLTVDDDVAYPANAWEHILELGKTNRAVIAHRGRRVRTTNDRIASYRSFTTPDGSHSFADLPNGRNGVLYRLGHFGIGPEHFAGPVIAPTADDLWAKCSTVLKGIPVQIVEPDAMDDVAKDYPEMFPELKSGLYHQYNAKGGNDQAFKSLEAYYSMHIEAPLARLFTPGESNTVAINQCPASQ